MRSTTTAGGRWAATAGRYEDVLPYFRKAEDNDTWDNRWHGKGGPLGVSKPSAPLPICEAYFAAAAELGIPRNDDMTGERQDGVGYYQLTQRNARRSSAAMAYLAPEPGPGQPDRPHRRAGPADRGRGRPRRRRRDDGRQPDHRGLRGHPLLRRDRLAAHADALGHRPGGPPGGGRRDDGARPARRGFELPGSPRPLRSLRGDGAAHLRPLRQTRTGRRSRGSSTC